jgi:hypothetical protein
MAEINQQLYEMRREKINDAIISSSIGLGLVLVGVALLMVVQP